MLQQTNAETFRLNKSSGYQLIIGCLPVKIETFNPLVR